MDKLMTNPAVESSGEEHITNGTIKKFPAIQEQYYVAVTSLCTAIVLRSSCLQMAVRTVISFTVLMLVWKLLMLVKSKMPAIPFVVFASFVAVIVGTITSEFFSGISFWGMDASKALLPEQLYLLLFVPFMVFQADNRLHKGRGMILKVFPVFSGVILLVAAFRELLGNGAIFGRNIMPEVIPEIELLRHSSGAALLLAAVIALSQWISHRKGSGSKFLTYPADDISSAKIPYLQIDCEKRFVSVSFLFLVSTILSGIFPMVLFVFIGSSTPLKYLLPVTVLTQGIVIGLIYLLSGPLRDTISDMCFRYMILPIQALLLLSPFYFENPGRITSSSMISSAISYSLYLSAGWFFVFAVIVFLKTVRRKLIFGRRPAWIEGLPITLIMVGICLIILSGFAPVIEKVMIGMFAP